MSESKNQRKPALSIGQVFAYRLRDARLTKKWSQQRLAAAMTAIGHKKIQQGTIAKIEAGAQGVGGEIHAQPRRGRSRPVSLEEAIAFAVALDVAPTNLYLPIGDEDDVELAPGKVVDVETARAWAKGEKSLSEDDRFYRLQAPFEKPQKPTVADLESLGIPVHEVPGKGLTQADFLGRPHTKKED